MTRFRKLSLIYLWNAFVFLIFFGICSFATMFLLDDIDIVRVQLLLIVPFFILLEIRRRSGNIFVFFAATAAVLAAACVICRTVITDWRHLLIIVLFLVIISGLSIYLRLAETTGEVSSALLILAVSINAALSIASGALDINELETLYIASSLIQFIIFIIHVRVVRLDYSLELIESTSVQPVHKIIDFNNLITVIIALLVSAAALLSVVLHAENLVYAAGRTLLAIIRFLVGLINSEPELIVPVETPSLPEGGGFDPSMFGAPKEPFILWVILEKIMYYGFYVLLIGGVIFGIGYCCYKIYKRFNDTLPENGDIREFLFTEIREEGTGGVFSGVREYFSKLFASGGNNNKVRRIFYKRVNGHISRGVAISGEDTTEDIRKKIIDREDVSGLTDIYRKARYSNEPVTDAEVAACKR